MLHRVKPVDVANVHTSAQALQSSLVGRSGGNCIQDLNGVHDPHTMSLFTEEPSSDVMSKRKSTLR